MARSMWRGAIQFGLVTIPVKLYLATEARGGLNFNLLHKTCLTKIQMKTYCPTHEEYIDRSETVRGFEFSKGEYVVITEEDLASLPLKTVRSIEIEMFVDAHTNGQGLQFVRQAYYLEPEPVGRKAFYLLKSVLGDMGLSGICKIVLKDREHLASINPYSSTMLLTSLYWPDEVRALDELDLPDQQEQFKPAEHQMAEQLVRAMTSDFTADEYRDDYRTALMAVIEAKVAGRPRALPQPAAPSTKLVDLMSVLEASVEAARETRKTDAKPARTASTRSKPAQSKAAASKAAASKAAAGAETARRAERKRKTA